MDYFSAVDPKNLTDSLLIVAACIANFVIAYFIALLFSVALKRVLTLREMEEFLIRHGAMTSKLWNSIASFIAQYLKWYLTLVIAVIGLDMTLASMLQRAMTVKVSDIAVVKGVFDFLSQLLWFIVLTVGGLIAGGVVYKVIKEALDGLGLEEQMKKQRIEGAFGDTQLSSILAGIVKWYVVLLFINEGTTKLNLQVLARFMGALVDYVPEAISGLLVLIVSIVLARFASERIRERSLSFGQIFAVGIESTIVFFGIVISMPLIVRGADVSILSDAFKILMVGVSLGMAIALGLGLKDSIADVSSRWGKRF
jgi:hypothetical protein